jgi:colanic acid/amylovoran biosynthesis protein
MALNVVITNSVALNGGDAAITEAIIQVVRANLGNDTKITIIDGNAETARKYYPEHTFEQLYLPAIPDTSQLRERQVLAYLRGHWHMLRFNLAKRHALFHRFLPKAARNNVATLAQADLIISAGGTYLVEHYGQGLRRRLEHLQLAQAMGKPVVLYTQSLGPFKDPANARKVREVLPNAKLVLLRDERSRRNLTEIGVPTDRLAVVADAVFIFAEPGRLQESAKRKLPEAPRIAVSVRNWRFFVQGDSGTKMNAYFEAVAQAIVRLVRERGAEVTFLSTCQGIAEYHTDDAKAAADVMALLPSDVLERIQINAEFHHPAELQRLLAAFDLVIATRMHMAILSLAAGTPVLPIAYEFKTTELFAALGAGDWVTDIETIEAESFAQRAISFVDGLAEIWPPMAGAVVEQYRSAEQAGQRLVDCLVR